MIKIAADDCSSILVYYVFIREKKKTETSIFIAIVSVTSSTMKRWLLLVFSIFQFDQENLKLLWCKHRSVLIICCNRCGVYDCRFRCYSSFKQNGAVAVSNLCNCFLSCSHKSRHVWLSTYSTVSPGVWECKI